MKPTTALLLVLALNLSVSCAQAPREQTPVLRAAPAPAAPSPASGWKLAEAELSTPLGEGITYLRNHLELPGPERGRTATIHFVRFDSSRHQIKVVDRGPEAKRYRDLEDAMQQHGAVAGCNGGFFHPDYRPLGLVIADGERIHRFETSKLLSGLLLVDGRGPRLLRRAEFKDGPGITQLLQSGPYLVDRGSAVAGLSASPERNRTFIATDGKGEWLIGYTSRLSLADLGRILDDPALLSGFSVTRGLNLDGGSSSSLYVNRGPGKSPFYYRGFATVRNYLAVVPR